MNGHRAAKIHWLACWLCASIPEPERRESVLMKIVRYVRSEKPGDVEESRRYTETAGIRGRVERRLKKLWHQRKRLQSWDAFVEDARAQWIAAGRPDPMDVQVSGDGVTV